MNRECTKCGIVKELTDFNINKQYKDGYTRQCKQCMYIANRKRHKNRKIIYFVYYLPEEHYCGHTNDVSSRMARHRHIGKNTENFKILFTTKTKKEAIYYEALFCSTLGINGL